MPTSKAIYHGVLCWVKEALLSKPANLARTLADCLREADRALTERPLKFRLRRLILLPWAQITCNILLRKESRLLKRASAYEPDAPERRALLLSALVSGLRKTVAFRRLMFHWADNTRGIGALFFTENVLVVLGLRLGLLDHRNPELSSSAWTKGDAPEICVNTSLFRDKVQRRHAVHHELGHEILPHGRGRRRSGHAKEVLVDRFAMEMSHPLPAIIQYAETDAEAMMTKYPSEEVMRTTSRQMFTVMIPVSGDYRRGRIILQAPASFSPSEDLKVHGDAIPQAWDDLVFWSKRGLVDFYPPQVSWVPSVTIWNDHGRLSFQTRDGLYYDVGDTINVWPLLMDAGILTWGFAASGPQKEDFCFKHIPEVQIAGCTIGGGRYLIVHKRKWFAPVGTNEFNEMHVLLAIEDGDGSLLRAWGKALGKRKPKWGPILPSSDPQRHDDLKAFNDWWTYPFNQREEVFDHWARMIEKKFCRSVSEIGEKMRIRDESAVVFDLLAEHVGEWSGPTVASRRAHTTRTNGFVADSVEKKLKKYAELNGQWNPFVEPVHLWAKELADHPVMVQLEQRRKSMGLQPTKLLRSVS